MAGGGEVGKRPGAKGVPSEVGLQAGSGGAHVEGAAVQVGEQGPRGRKRGWAGLRKERPLLDTPLEVHRTDDRTPGGGWGVAVGENWPQAPWARSSGVSSGPRQQKRTGS